MTLDCVVRAGELMVQGNTSVDPRSYPNEAFDLLSIPAFDAGEPEVTSGSEIGSAKQLVRPNDVLISKIVPHIRRSWVVGPNRGRRQIASGEWIVFRSERVFPGYLRHALVSDGFHSQFMQTVSGVGGSLLRARPSHVANIGIPVPPLPEQRRIAEVLDRAETLRAQRRQALAQLDALAEAIFVERFGADGGRVARVRLANVSVRITDGTHLTPRFIDQGVPFIFVKNVRNGHINFDTDRFISKAEHAALYKRCPVEPGDILYTTVGATYGQAASVGAFTEFAFQRHIAHIKPDAQKVLPAFLGELMQLPLVKQQADRWARGVAQPTVNLTELREFKIPLPTLVQQREFVTRISAVHALRAAQLASAAQLDGLFTSLQHRAFRGEL